MSSKLSQVIVWPVVFQTHDTGPISTFLYLNLITKPATWLVRVLLLQGLELDVQDSSVGMEETLGAGSGGCLVMAELPLECSD